MDVDSDWYLKEFFLSAYLGLDAIFQVTTDLPLHEIIFLPDSLYLDQTLLVQLLEGQPLVH